MLATQSVIDTLADRIERAYRLRRRVGWQGGCSTPRVWAAAAATLLRAREADRNLPLDPELFVVAQPAGDPWLDLTGYRAIARYQARVAEIVLGLRDELAGEVRRAEARIGRGQPVARVLLSRDRGLSPLGRLIVAHRAGRPALAGRFYDGALEQHRSCPLYRQAVSAFLPAEHYPKGDPPVTPPAAAKGRPRIEFLPN